MRIKSQRPVTLLSSIFLFPGFISANFDCGTVVADDVVFHLKELGGPYSVTWIREHPPRSINNTFTIDICNPLKRTSGVDKKEECPSGTHICDIQHEINESGENEAGVPLGVIPIAGQYKTSIGGDLNARTTRLKTSASHADSEKEGLRLEMEGGKYLDKKQRAVIELLCKRDTNEAKPTERRRRRTNDEPRDDDEGNKKPQEGEEADDGQGGKLKFLSYKNVHDVGVLRLQWDTKYACENSEAGNRHGGGWGFFSWIFFLAFLGLIAYLIFTIWYNYTRYDARGWDLVPHGDTIRDVPYILQDWFRKVVDTVQGGGSRGGYSAV